jgi:hypothetical protein
MVAGKAALTEANRHTDIVYTSFFGISAIVLVLLGAVALPVFGQQPVNQLNWFFAIAGAAFLGIGYLCYVNLQVHRHVGDQARLTEVLVNSLGQGFLSFTYVGKCGRVYSQACLDLLETIPAGKQITDVLCIPEEQRADFIFSLCPTTRWALMMSSSSFRNFSRIATSAASA